jgi:hypothetical protein
MKTKYILLMVLIINTFGLKAQRIYTTDEGHILIMSQVDNENVKVESHNMSFALNYTTKEVNGVLDLSTLSTNFTPIKKAINDTNESLKVHFNGTIPVTDFMVPNHEPIIFNWLLTITYQNKSYKALFKTTIQHVDEGISISCFLSARGEMEISETELQKVIPGLDHTLQIQFSQLLLKI